METFLACIVVGFVGQMIDGSLGMAYGVSCNTFLLALGIPPAVSSASLHAAEVVTTGVSGAAHFKLGNIRKDLFLRLLIPGVIGGGLGAYALSHIDGKVIKPYISGYLLIMGVVIIVKGCRKAREYREVKRGIEPLALVGGLLDAMGGGGWGPVVTTTLVARGNQPRETIGSVNASEFFVTLAESVVFVMTIGLSHWQIILGLLLGGVVAAPLAALVTRRLPVRVLMVLVGVLVSAVSLRTIVIAFLQ
ncbi:MAG: sulfite exporter TauE/SafE family protein [Deltaproteobacteria bacterium]|nr:sulfite exporter TauE/SafE family protein [Deltaproteobacteria bacterium]